MLTAAEFLDRASGRIHATKLRLKNWKCFEGETELALGPTTYAIVARHERDRDRSNWLGKSSLLEAVDYALWGRLAKSVRTKKGWITEGQKGGEVELTLSDGTRVVRQMGVHASEKLWCFPVVGGADAVSHQDEAQAAIARIVGISKDDFVTTCYFQQRQMARLILCEPGPRMDLVAGWIRLAPLQACEESALDALSEVTRRRTELEVERDLCWRLRHETLSGFPEGTDVESVLEHAEREARELHGKWVLARGKSDESKERRSLEPHARRYLAIVDEGKRLKENLAPGASEEEIAAAREALRVAGERKGVADRELASRARLTTGRFDGVCPLVGEPCPSRKFVEGGRERNDALRAESEAAAAEVGRGYDEAARQLSKLQEGARRSGLEARRLADLREEARRLKPSWDRWRALPDDGDEAVIAEATAAEAHRAAVAMADRVREVLKSSRKNFERARELEGQIAALDAASKTASAAVAIFGKNGAQRRIAEGVLGEIEARAAGTFRRCGIELSVRTVWSREGDAPATTCGACGQAFPASARVKECSRCGAPRGKNLVNKLDFEVSDRSGGAEDLAGGVLQLAASGWLREDRGSDWGVAMLDEPFGQMDASNRRAFAGHLPGILGDAGFRQSFVIAHHAGVLDALPGRIEISSDGRRSTARVVA
jgi:DNA repair exonuclease SbcCD ATPase subunit